MRVLVVEDEKLLADSIADGLRRQAMAVDIAYDGEAALERATVHDYDVVVLDRDIPGVHGDEVCAVLVRDHPGTRVLMLTAAGRLRDKVDGFSLGADDYLTKPFALEELVVRLRALARRPTVAVDPVLRVGDLRLDPYRREAHRGARPLRLPRKQFAVLELLMRADGAVVTAETLLEKVWDEHADPFTSAPRVAVSHLRKALGDPDPVVTVPGVGYRLVDPGRER
jgi:two-component system, OmpR family, response regulator VanR